MRVATFLLHYTLMTMQAMLVRCLATSTAPLYQALKSTALLNPVDGSYASALEGTDSGRQVLCVLLPQLGDFDCAEYIEQLIACEKELKDANMVLRVIAIGDANSAGKFSRFTGLPLDSLRMDPTASLYQELQLHRGPDWEAPKIIPEKIQPKAKAWINYMAMCSGISAPGTLKEIFRGYVGDKTAPERLTDADQVKAGPITITGTRKVKIGPFIEYEQSWKDEKGYQRPVELATIRLKNMVEVLSNWGQYVPDASYLAYRGATFIFEDGKTVYEWRTPGVLTYSETMSRPLSFLAPYIGAAKANNPLGLGDNDIVV